MARLDFDVDEFLALPLTARLATNGPTVRPVWYLWEGGSFWILTGSWARLPKRVEDDPAVAIVADDCDLATGTVRQVIARGEAELLPFDIARGRRMLSRYLGAAEECWDPRFRRYLHGQPDSKQAIWLRLQPRTLSATDLSYAHKTD